MGAEQFPDADATAGGPITVSTGQTIELPLSMDGTVLGAVFSASRTQVETLFPEGLQPIRATPGGERRCRS